jgi:hypothetical protein
LSSAVPAQDALITWRTFYVTVIFVVMMLGNMQVRQCAFRVCFCFYFGLCPIRAQWTLATGGSVDQGRTTAMNTLVFAQCFYCVSCRCVS